MCDIVEKLTLYIDEDKNMKNIFSIDFDFSDSKQRNYGDLKEKFENKTNLIESSLDSKFFLETSLKMKEVLNIIKDYSKNTPNDKYIIIDLKNYTIESIGITEKNVLELLNRLKSWSKFIRYIWIMFF